MNDDEAVVKISHLINDYETLRTKGIKPMQNQIQLLTDGLAALQGGSLEIVQEFMERTLDIAQSELSRLKGSQR